MLPEHLAGIMDDLVQGLDQPLNELPLVHLYLYDEALYYCDTHRLIFPLQYCGECLAGAFKDWISGTDQG